MTIEQCEKFIKYYEELGEANWRSEDGYFIDACRTVLTQQAQVAMLREALDRVLHEFVRSDVTMEGEYWALRCLPQAKVAATAKDARSTLAATPADAQSWLEKQRKLAAAEALDTVHDWVRKGNDYDRNDARDEIARAIWNRMTQLRKEVGE